MFQFQVFLTSKGGFWRVKSSIEAPSLIGECFDRPIYQLCSKKGHTTDRCYKWFDVTYRPPPPRARPPSPRALFVHLGFAPHESWYLDSGASAHVSSDLNCLSTYSPYAGSEQFKVGDDKGLNILYTGLTILVTNSKSLVLNNVLHVPSISKSLLSISRLISNNNVIVEFNASSCLIKNQVTSQVLLQGIFHNGLFLLSSSSTSPQALHYDVASFET
jgi:hypothetical protein